MWLFRPRADTGHMGCDIRVIWVFRPRADRCFGYFYSDTDFEICSSDNLQGGIACIIHVQRMYFLVNVLGLIM